MIDSYDLTCLFVLAFLGITSSIHSVVYSLKLKFVAKYLVIIKTPFVNNKAHKPCFLKEREHAILLNLLCLHENQKQARTVSLPDFSELRAMGLWSEHAEDEPAGKASCNGRGWLKLTQNMGPVSLMTGIIADIIELSCYMFSC